ncbi:hypothetical protein [Palpita vitrealis nucleopolyhedrovirus]|uniref:DUF3627 domain-containing protein n=1 Tax=Palpita vitrealis nucleopolyhedrovirus TaxID=2951960 RepID=A0AAE9LN61_9ABAC|nr:hypothetical protein [Palpita vitrealis nucleopolyhedrovirus]
MLSWLWSWWINSICVDDNISNVDDDEHDINKFDVNDYRKYNIIGQQYSHIIKWDSFKFSTHSFKYRYVHGDAYRFAPANKFYNVIDFCKGLEIAFANVLECNWSIDEIYHLNKIIFNKPDVGERDVNSLGALFATKAGLVKFLMTLNFKDKTETLMHIQIESERDNLQDKIESVLKHVKQLNENSEKFIITHETFKDNVTHKFEQFELRLHELDAKLNVLQSAENLKTAIVDAENNKTVTYPRDVTKHQHLAVFSERVANGLKVAFVSGQERHFRKRKMQFEDNMDVLYEGVHPNPTMAIQCINEKLYDKRYKVRKLNKRTIDVNCTANIIKDVIQEVL